MRRAYVPLIIAIYWLSACQFGTDTQDIGRTTNTDSSAFDNNADRVEFLTRYASVPSPVLETEFRITYTDHSTGRLTIPGPSDWNINYAVRVEPTDLELWTEGFTTIDPEQVWDESLIDAWDMSSEQPVFYHRPGMTRAIYEADSVVIGFATTNGTSYPGPPEG